MRIIALLLTIALPAAADPQALAERGRQLAAEGDWLRAAEAFEASIAEARDPHLFDDLGDALRKLGDAQRAIEVYKRYLNEVPSAPNAGEVARQLRVLELAVGKKGSPIDDQVAPRIDHQPREEWSPNDLIAIQAFIRDDNAVFEPKVYYRVRGVGTFVPSPMRAMGDDLYIAYLPPADYGELHYFIEAYDKKGNGPARRGTEHDPLTIQIREPKPVLTPPPPAPLVAAPPPEPVPVPEPAPAAPLPEPVAQSTSRGPWAYVTLGAGVLAAGAGAYFGMRVISEADTWRRATTDQTKLAGRDSTQSTALFANVAWGAAGVLAASGGMLLLFTEF